MQCRLCKYVFQPWIFILTMPFRYDFITWAFDSATRVETIRTKFQNFDYEIIYSFKKCLCCFNPFWVCIRIKKKKKKLHLYFTT